MPKINTYSTANIAMARMIATASMAVILVLSASRRHTETAACHKDPVKTA
jgi:hypothetical protein